MAISGSRDAETSPVEPPATQWQLPGRAQVAGHPGGVEVVARGAELTAGTLLAGYRRGLFAMPQGRALYWWSPDPRGVLDPGEVHVARSMNRVLNRYRVSLNADFAGVLSACADPRRPGAWISAGYSRAYRDLHDLGWAHSVEVWSGDEVVAGLFGVEVGGLFAAESMFHRPEHGACASRTAVIGLCELLARDGALVDVQWWTPHLDSLGVRQIPRTHYLAGLPDLLAMPPRLFGLLPVSQPGSRIRWRNAGSRGRGPGTSGSPMASPAR